MQINDLEMLLQQRHTSRGLFDPDRPISKEDMQRLLEAARWAPTAHNMQNFQILVVDDREKLTAISEMQRDVDIAFVRENAKLLSFTEEELQQKKVGVMATNFPQSWRSANREPDSKDPLLHAFLGVPIQRCAALFIILYDPEKRAPGSEGDFLGHISLGCVIENMWLMAEALGIGFHILSMIHAASVELEIKQLLKIPPTLRIAFGVRMGYLIKTAEHYLRVRRDVKDFFHYNEY